MLIVLNMYIAFVIISTFKLSFSVSATNSFKMNAKLNFCLNFEMLFFRCQYVHKSIYVSIIRYNTRIFVKVILKNN